LAWLAAEVVSVGVHVPQSPGGIGTDLRPETLNSTTAVRVVSWTADRDFGVTNNGTTLEGVRAA